MKELILERLDCRLKVLKHAPMPAAQRDEDVARARHKLGMALSQRAEEVCTWTRVSEKRREAIVRDLEAWDIQAGWIWDAGDEIEFTLHHGIYRVTAAEGHFFHIAIGSRLAQAKFADIVAENYGLKPVLVEVHAHGFKVVGGLQMDKPRLVLAQHKMLNNRIRIARLRATEGIGWNPETSQF